MRPDAHSVKGEREPGFTICVEPVTIAVTRTFVDRLL
jgi:hypothetical protein